MWGCKNSVTTAGELLLKLHSEHSLTMLYNIVLSLESEIPAASVSRAASVLPFGLPLADCVSAASHSSTETHLIHAFSLCQLCGAMNAWVRAFPPGHTGSEGRAEEMPVSQILSK